MGLWVSARVVAALSSEGGGMREAGVVVAAALEVGARGR